MCLLYLSSFTAIYSSIVRQDQVRQDQAIKTYRTVSNFFNNSYTIPKNTQWQNVNTKILNLSFQSNYFGNFRLKIIVTLERKQTQYKPKM